MNRELLLKRLNDAWNGLRESYAGLPEAKMIQPGVTGEWSVKDLLAHITTWEEESLKHMPLILRGGRPEKYSVQYGGLDAFNALRVEQKRKLPLSEVLKQFEETHRRLIEYVRRIPEDQIMRETRCRRRLRLDTYSHYPKHARAIRQWRQNQKA